MANFFRMLVIVAIVGVVIIACLLVFDIFSYAETRDMAKKILVSLGIVALGGASISFIAGLK